MLVWEENVCGGREAGANLIDEPIAVRVAYSVIALQVIAVDQEQTEALALRLCFRQRQVQFAAGGDQIRQVAHWVGIGHAEGHVQHIAKGKDPLSHQFNGPDHLPILLKWLCVEDLERFLSVDGFHPLIQIHPDPRRAQRGARGKMDDGHRHHRDFHAELLRLVIESPEQLLGAAVMRLP